MPIKTKEELQLLFQTGDKPNQQDFQDLIDSLDNDFVVGYHEVTDVPVTEIVFSGLNSSDGYKLLSGIVANAPVCDINTYFNGEDPALHRNTKLATVASTSAGYPRIFGITLKSHSYINSPTNILGNGNWEPTPDYIEQAYFVLDLGVVSSLGQVYLYSDRSTTNRYQILGSNDGVGYISVGYLQCVVGGAFAILDSVTPYRYYKFLCVSGSGGPNQSYLYLYSYVLGNPIICGEVYTSLTGASVGVGKASYANDGTQYNSAPQLINPAPITSIAQKASVVGGIGVGSKFLLLKNRRV